MGHRGRSGLSAGEWLFQLAHFGSLERSYFNGKLFQCGSDEGESREVVGVPVALNYLARHRSGFQTQLGAGIFSIAGDTVAWVPTGPEILP